MDFCAYIYMYVTKCMKFHFWYYSVHYTCIYTKNVDILFILLPYFNLLVLYGLLTLKSGVWGLFQAKHVITTGLIVVPYNCKEKMLSVCDSNKSYTSMTNPSRSGHFSFEFINYSMRLVNWLIISHWILWIMSKTTICIVTHSFNAQSPL